MIIDEDKIAHEKRIPYSVGYPFYTKCCACKILQSERDNFQPGTKKYKIATFILTLKNHIKVILKRLNLFGLTSKTTEKLKLRPTPNLN